jgi:DNA mismatch repair protein MutS
LTKKRSDILVEKLKKEGNSKYEILKYNGANVKIMSPKIKEYSDKLIELKEEIKKITQEQYLKCLEEFENKYIVFLNILSEFIAEIDFINCGAKCAKIYKYVRPNISLKEGLDGSYFSAKEIRHPIIELIHDQVEYIKNDVELIHEKCNGILLYGVNGVGKSSLSKAIGCNIVLAQMGFYVAASEFTYYPYTKIFTRINGDDNMFKGQSSFAIEMDELRSILKYSDCRSIVLGDEICKGTEETSALAIVSSSILRFCQKNVNFIMATHFHKLISLEDIQNIENIKFMHLSVEYDKKEQLIIYGRKLEEGPGDTLYGVEIADFLIQDLDFIRDAKRIRNIILEKEQTILSEKTSNYNNKLYMDKCSICGDYGYKYPLDTHHIKEQHTFNDEDIHKDKLSNLVILCKKHHDKVHHGNLEIDGYIETSKGKKLVYKVEDELENIENIEKTKENKNKKYNEEQINFIKNLAEELKDQKQFMKILLLELKKQNIVISAKTVNKICDNTY